MKCPKCGFLLLGLSLQELEVARRLALPNKVIAQQLIISGNTVRSHVRSIMLKTTSESRTEAVLRLLMHSVIRLPDESDAGELICEVVQYEFPQTTPLTSSH